MGEKESDKWSYFQYVGRAGSVIPTASLPGTEVSVEEIRSAAAVSDTYPPSIHAPLVGSPEPYENGMVLFAYNFFPIELFLIWVFNFS